MFKSYLGDGAIATDCSAELVLVKIAIYTPYILLVVYGMIEASIARLQRRLDQQTVAIRYSHWTIMENIVLKVWRTRLGKNELRTYTTLDARP